MKMDEIKDMDYLELIKTDEYADMQWRLSISSDNDFSIFGNTELTLKGDVHSIMIHRDGTLSISVLYDFDCRTGEHMAVVNVSDKSLIEVIRREMETSKGVRLKVRCALEGVKTFDLVSIEEMNKTLLFPIYQCEKCGHSYGHIKPDSPLCIICLAPFKFEEA